MNNKEGYFGNFGGRFVPEALRPPLMELEQAMDTIMQSPAYRDALQDLLVNYAGRETPLTFCPHLSEKLGFRLWLKREDLLHTGAHKINNALGQALLARMMGKTRLIAETGAGQHGVATATAAARLKMDCTVFMGAEDVEQLRSWADSLWHDLYTEDGTASVLLGTSMWLNQGVDFNQDTLERLAAVLTAKSQEYGHPIYLISDEPYRELAYDGAEVPWLPNCCKNTIVGYSWSKSLSLPGERIGYLVIPSDIVDAQLIFDAAVVANRMLGFVNAPSLMQLAVARCLDASTDIDAYDANRKLLYNGLHELGYECEYPAGAFYLWVKTPVAEPEFVALAKKYNLLLVPGASFGCEGYVRLAYCVSGDMIKRSMASFAKLAEECGLKK